MELLLWESDKSWKYSIITYFLKTGHFGEDSFVLTIGSSNVNRGITLIVGGVYVEDARDSNGNWQKKRGKETCGGCINERRFQSCPSTVSYSP